MANPDPTRTLIRSIIVDDQKSFLKSFRDMAGKHFAGRLDLFAECTSVGEARHAIHTFHPELIFLDIELGEETGFDLLEQIEDPTFDVIFTTAHEHYAIRAIRFSAIDYLLKPIGPDDLAQALSRYENIVGSRQILQRLDLLHQNMKTLGDPCRKIALPTFQGFEVVDLKEIICLTSSSNYTTFSLVSNRELMVSHPLREYEDLLEEFDFFRIHQSHMVNMYHVKKYLKTDGGAVVLSNGRSVDISRRKRDDFLKRLQNIVR